MKVLSGDQWGAVVRWNGRHYIRCRMGMEEYPVFQRITDEEAKAILAGEMTRGDVLKCYRGVFPTSREDAKEKLFRDYFEYDRNLNQEEIKEALRLLKKAPAFETEFYLVLAGEERIEDGLVEVDGMTALDYKRRLGLGTEDTYAYLIKKLENGKVTIQGKASEKDVNDPETWKKDFLKIAGGTALLTISVVATGIAVTRLVKNGKARAFWDFMKM